MALSPLKAPSPYSSRRRGGGGWSLVLMVLAGLSLLAWAWSAFLGFDARLRRAARLAQSGRAGEAAARLEGLRAKHPGDPRVHAVRGLLANRAGRLQEAAASYAASQGAGAAWSEIHVQEGEHYLLRGNYGAAEVEFVQAARNDPGNPLALQGQAVCAHAQGHLARSMELYQKALKIDASLKSSKEGLRKARESRDRGVLYYMFDRNEQPLARLGIAQDAPTLRSYPFSHLTSHIVGARSEKFGDFGMEKAFGPIFPGIEVKLTLDARIQDLASKAMGWRKGAVVVLDVDSGEILAALSQPSFKPEDLDKRPYVVRGNENRPLLNRAFDGLYEPGSIVKIITAAAAIEANVDMSRIFPMRPDTSILIEGRIFRDWENHGKVRSLKEAMDVSSNIALYRVAAAMGPDLLFEYINRFGFNQAWDLGVDVPGLGRFDVPVTASRAPLKADSLYQLAERACGLGRDYRITPLHAALLAAVVARGGVLPRPRLVKEVRNLAGQVLYACKPEVQREVMRPATADKLRQIMVDAVQSSRGIGSRARVPGVLVAGKTGTARTRQYSQLLDAWFICFAPADKPQYAIAVLGDGEGTGMTVAAPIAGALLKSLMR